MKKLFGLDFSNLRGDLLGGLTAGIVALPLALAFGLQSGLGATAGLYGAIFISFFAALFGGTNTQISGPTAPMTAVSMVVIASMVAAHEGDVGRALPYILTVFLLAGLIQVGLGFLKVGQYIRYIPYPVVSGFMTGIGVIILITQLFPMLGYYPKEDQQLVKQYLPQAEQVLYDRILNEEKTKTFAIADNFKTTLQRANEITPADLEKEAVVLTGKNSSGVIGTIKQFKNAINKVNYTDLLLALLTIFIIYGFKRITTTIPSTLVALLLTSIGAFLFLPTYRTIGEIPSGFPVFQTSIFTAFSWSALSPYILVTFSLAVLGAIDSLLTSVVADNMTKTKHNPNQELVGQGIGNSIAALFGGIPGAGATIRTVVNINSGAKTKLSGMTAGLVLLVILLSLSSLASKIPAAVLAGILITVGIGVMDYKGLKHLRQLPISEVVVMITVLLLTVFVGLIEAVGVGMLLASILFMKKISDVAEQRTTMQPLQEFSIEKPWKGEETIINKVGDKVFIKHLDGPLFFGFAARFQDMIKALPEVKVVIIRMGKVPYVDQSGLYAMENAIMDLQKKGIKVVFINIHGQPLDMFKDFNLIPGLIDSKYCFPNLKSCIVWLEEYLETELIVKV